MPSMVTKSTGTILVSLVALMLTTNPAPTAEQSSPQQRCAMRDVQTLILIEDHGEAGYVLPERVAKAGLMQMEARLACTAGRYAEGVALYDEIIRALGRESRAERMRSDQGTPKPNTMSKKLSFIGDPSRSDGRYQLVNRDKQCSTAERMSVGTKLIIATALVACAILHLVGGSLMASVSDRPTAERTYLSGAD